MRPEPEATLSLAPGAIDLAALPRDEVERMGEAGSEIVEIRRILGRTGDNVVAEILRNQGTFYEWDHYPSGDVYDHESHAQYYYHAHPLDRRFEGEHGHFHTFLRAKGMPAGIKPAPIPGAPMPEDPNDALSHLIAISMDGDGEPFRLFTVNRWVTGEVWYQAEHVCSLLDHFKIDHAQPSWPTNRWITAMIALFRPQIRELVTARDRCIAAWQSDRPDGDTYEDRDLEVTSYVDISVDRQLETLRAFLGG
ncbi:MAG: hypothetical protein QNJ30_18700 [Kiloniellales bacterium]|nr:hypothetical protein [Kiloniellales bacterium]